mmetsp:Transcript_18682/g.23319  ORF Transcript_18682/g.23319 Transcript_18682/m.23319 type:complete len:103 (-) Transcript_18682:331-639(-)|eukprot:CAMPEP_0170465788 /NCGR_PEP_ID=MMETSP0123-20130129/9996_1 /TAXON_ID=182087 /ORGANISM="Favella ehrenbergii, Strain Fehren 1" /LENGTH=102 /DNA_ID=CAMNT_0010731763 /DNA_START=1234 /DNA_END=1542 /DNA_ORIENTATION=-
MEDKLRKEVNETQSLKDEYKRVCRTGRQPALRGSIGGDQKKKDRVSGKSFGAGTSSSETVSDSSSLIDPRNVMQIPELDDENEEPCFGGALAKELTKSNSTG